MGVERSRSRDRIGRGWLWRRSTTVVLAQRKEHHLAWRLTAGELMKRAAEAEPAHKRRK